MTEEQPSMPEQPQGSETGSITKSAALPAGQRQVARGVPYALERDLEKRFTYHAPKEGQPARYTQLRDKAKQLAALICEQVPQSRERSLALTHLEEAVMWANAGIARNE